MVQWVKGLAIKPEFNPWKKRIKSHKWVSDLSTHLMTLTWHARVCIHTHKNVY